MRDKLFYRDIESGISITYSQLLKDIHEQTSFSPYLKSNSFYDVFRGIIISLLLGREIILLDSDFSNNEVERLIGDVSLLNETFCVNIPEDISEDNILFFLKQNVSSWKISLFSSGTTGGPKKVSHTFGAITRFVRTEEKYKNDIWGLAYNPTHMAGLQVFFQALLNMNSIIRLFKLDKNFIIREIKENEITNISATPTFYRLLLPSEDICSSVVRLTSGGEKFDGRALIQLQAVFPNAKVTNIYASTEAGSLFASKTNEFVIKEELKPFVKVERSELFLHKSLMGESFNLFFQGDWYATGDLVTIAKENPLTFVFVSRKNEMINTGGYKVNPTEVEELIRLCEGVQDAFVYGKKNSLLGNVICCEVVKSHSTLTEKDIRDFLKDKLQEFKIPRVVRFVDSLAITRTGKLSRI